MNARSWAGARAVTALGRGARGALILGILGGCGSGGEPAPTPLPPVKDACAGECPPGEMLLENGCCQPAGLPPDMLCPPGEWPRDSGGCQPAGLPLDMLCPPGEWLREDGGCQPAGVPPEECAQGFAPDGEGGCDVILPAEDCPKGQMAIPGETVCHEVTPCGSGDYGDIPVEQATTQFVNQAYAGVDSDGSEAKPWKSIQEGIDAAEPGAIVAVAAGTYVEEATIQGKPVVLWGRCPALVEVAGTGPQLGAVQVFGENAEMSEIRGLAITGVQGALVVIGASGVVVEGVWIHDAGYGLYVTDEYGPTSAKVTSSLIEATHEFGAFIGGADVDLSRVVVRDILPTGAGTFGDGITILEDPGTNVRANVQITASVVERAYRSGVSITGSNAVFSGGVVRDILPDEAGISGRGINVQPGSERANVQVIASVVERAHGVGVHVSGSDVEIVGVVVRDVQPDGAGLDGRGLSVQVDPQTSERSSVQVIRSVVERTHEIGVFVAGSDAVLSGVVVRDILPEVGTGSSGRGIQIQNDLETNERASARVTASVVERAPERGVVIIGSDAVFSGTVVRDIGVPSGAMASGRGIQVQRHPETNERASVQVIASMVERTQDTGVFVWSSDVELVGVVVRDILPGGTGLHGGGITIQDGAHADGRANVQVTGSVVERTHETGVRVFGSDAELVGVVVRDIMPSAAGAFGDGIFVRDNPATNGRSRVQITASVIERTHEAGVVVAGSDAELVGVVVRDVLPNGAGRLGDGILIMLDRETNQPAAVSIRASLVERNREIGVYIFNSQATIEGLMVRGTMANGLGLYGDGIVVDDGPTSQVTITATVVDSNARAGLASWGAPVRFAGTVLSCNAFDLQGEVYNGNPFSFPDSHDNVCGCPAVADVCNALSTGLAPPSPLGDMPMPIPDPGLDP